MYVLYTCVPTYVGYEKSKIRRLVFSSAAHYSTDVGRFHN
jgi:hypothetical protein